MSISRHLREFHECDPRFLGCVSEHPIHGKVDWTHLPLEVLAGDFPDVMARFDTHTSFAVARDPMQRFESAMAQRAKMYIGKELAQFDKSDLRSEIFRVISHLDSGQRLLPAEFAHFTRQTDFVFLEEKQVVRFFVRLGFDLWQHSQAISLSELWRTNGTSRCAEQAENSS